MLSDKTLGGNTEAGAEVSLSAVTVGTCVLDDPVDTSVAKHRAPLQAWMAGLDPENVRNKGLRSVCRLIMLCMITGYIHSIS